MCSWFNNSLAFLMIHSKCTGLLAVSFWQTWCHADKTEALANTHIYHPHTITGAPEIHTLPTVIMQTDTYFTEDFLLNRTVFPSKQHNTPYPYLHSHYMTCVSDYGAIPGVVPHSPCMPYQTIQAFQRTTPHSFLPLPPLATCII